MVPYFVLKNAGVIPVSYTHLDVYKRQNYALDAGFNPMKDALFMEDSDSPYVNIITTRKGDENSPAIKKLIEALTSEDIRNFIIEKYEGAVCLLYTSRCV